MWQEITVYSIGILTIVYIIVKTYRFFSSLEAPEKDASCTCTGCPGCHFKQKK